MLSDAVKKSIQTAYSTYLKSKDYTARRGQKLMIAEVARMLGGIQTNQDGIRVNESGIALVEAGTGTGKTVAYLLAALPYAKANGYQVIVSTATIALQEQILLKDLPDIAKHSGLEFDYQLAKGRGRYMCLQKLDQNLQLHQGALANLPMFEELQTEDESNVVLMEDMLNQYGMGEWDGEYESWEQQLDKKLWSSLTSNHRECGRHRCPHFQNCALYKARGKLDTTDIIVANHDLVMADLSMGGGAILSAPKNSIYIFDEGHHVASKALDHFANELTIKSAMQAADQFKKQMANLKPVLAVESSLSALMDDFEQGLQMGNEYLLGLQYLLQSIVDSLEEPLENNATLRLAEQYLPTELLDQMDLVKTVYSNLMNFMNSAEKKLKQALGDEGNEIDRVNAENWLPVVGRYSSRFEAVWQLCSQFLVLDEQGPPRARWLTWIDNEYSQDMELHCSPILAAGLLDKFLWQEAFAAVLTSATLSTNKNFDRIIKQTGVPDYSSFAMVESPFDYQKQAVFEVPQIACEANFVKEHTQSIIDGIPELLSKEKGCLVLFSSRKQMWQVLEGLAPEWQKRVLVQDQQPKSKLIEEHKQRVDDKEGSIIFGLASFAEGIDLPGDYLTQLMIAKIPFVTPDDPLSASLAEWIEQNGGNSFMQLSVPDACIKLVQACGRLIRNEKDEGIIYFMDRRICTKRYGQQLINSLPNFQFKW